MLFIHFLVQKAYSEVITIECNTYTVILLDLCPKLFCTFVFVYPLNDDYTLTCGFLYRR